jgi:hypothetical protein
VARDRDQERLELARRLERVLDEMERNVSALRGMSESNGTPAGLADAPSGPQGGHQEGT